MKKQVSTFLFFLFSIAMAAQVVPATIDKPKTKSHSTVTAKEPNLPVVSRVKTVTYATIDSIANDGIENKVYPGCQVLVLKDGKPVYNKCFGYLTYKKTEKVMPTTMYDLASLSKTTGTLIAIMKLYDDKKLSLTDKASMYLPFLRGTDKENITITELLFHESGLAASLPFYKMVIEEIRTKHKRKSSSRKHPKVDNSDAGVKVIFKDGWVSKTYSDDYKIHVAENFYVANRFHDEAMQKIAKSRLNAKVYNYSDVNFMLLKEIVETISGKTLDVFLNEGFYKSMKLDYLTYLPLETHKKDEIAPTIVDDVLRGKTLQGYVHDDSAAFMGGISGNAGLFADAADVSKVYQMILNGGEIDGIRYISQETCRVFTTTLSASGRRGLGYDKPVPTNPRINPCCDLAPTTVFGHTGYTGTCCWVDPVNKLVFVFLSNRVYPNDASNKLSKMQIRKKIQEAIYQILM
ncbi:MAG: serine hydrolase [Paludibacter sp.]|nr:serine hydrolase [Paludibacter sp.]